MIDSQQDKLVIATQLKICSNILEQIQTAVSLLPRHSLMKAFPHLTNAPVVEALVVFQADASTTWDSQDIRSLITEPFKDFGIVQEQRSFQGHFVMEPGKEPETNTTVSPIEAFILNRADKTEAIQIRRDGFAFSQLKPYPDWETFISSAMRHWETYRGLMNIESTHNLSIRFINLLSYPSEGFKLSNYFRNSPQRPEGSEWDFGFFREHYLYGTKDKKFQINSIFSLVPNGNIGANVEFTLDLSISLTRSLQEIQQPISELLNEMRVLKNEAFFSKLKDEALAPYL